MITIWVSKVTKCVVLDTQTVIMDYSVILS
jgi:hypothetical protein